MTRPQPLPHPYRTDKEILANALISDRAEYLRIDQLAPSVQAHIEGGRKAGLHLVSVRWPTGQLVLTFCALVHQTENIGT
jgi:hypothetical protein